MGNAGRNGGEYYTPRPLIRAIVQVVQPKIGERIYDGAVGSAGFLCESFDYLKQTNPKRTTAQDRTLQERTFYGKEKKSLAYVIAIMNMILHGIEAPNIIHTNTLTENLADIQEKDRYDVVLANPPFGGKERKEVQQNFPIRTGETAFLFLQHFIKMLKAGGRGGVVIKNTFLSNTDNASVSLRKLLLESCNLHTVLDCPGGTFQGAGVKTVVLFFEKGAPDAQGLVLPARPRPQPRQDQPAQRRRPRRVREAAKDLRRLAQELERGRQEHRPDDLRPLREEPERRRGNHAPQPAGDHGRNRRAGRRERGGAGEHQGAAMKNGWETKELERCLPLTMATRKARPASQSAHDFFASPTFKTTASIGKACRTARSNQRTFPNTAWPAETLSLREPARRQARASSWTTRPTQCSRRI